MTRRSFAALALGAVQSDSRRRQILRGMELVMGPLPAGASPALEVLITSEQEKDGYRIALISYVAEEGDRVPAYLLTPIRREARLPAVVCLHQTTPIGKAEPAGLGGKLNLHYAAELARRGFVAIAPDYPGFGDYRFDSYAHGYASATMKGILNHMRAIDVLQSLPAVDPRRVGAIGHSLGGHNALFLAAFDERVRAVVTSCGFTSFRRYMGGDLTGWSHRGYMPRIAGVYGRSPARIPFDFSDVLEAIAPRPVFVNAPLRDSNFDATGVDEAVQAALRAERTTFRGRIIVRHPAAGHDFPADVREEAYAFLARSLAASGVSLRRRDESGPIETAEAFQPVKSAFILCDMWDRHWCRGANERLAPIVEKARPLLAAARRKGAVIIHAPSDTMDFYRDAPQRRAALAVPRVQPPALLDITAPPLPIDDSGGGCDTGDKSFKAWTRQHAGVRIAPEDYVSDKGEEVYSILRARGIETLFILGVHTNMCILNRTFAIKQMTRWGVRCVLIRDLTDAMYNPADRPYVSHAQGTNLVIEHIERYWCPSVTSEDLLSALR